MKIHRFDVLILVLWIGACVILYDRIIPNDYFGYDEADHMFAVSKGLYANYVDENTIPFFTFLKVGVEQGFQKQQGSSLSAFIRASDDLTFYRHYHGPLYFYALIISRYFLGDSEYAARWTSLIFLIVSIIAVYVGCLVLSQENATVAAVIASTMLMCSSPNIITAAQISAHSMYTLTSIVTLFFMAKLLQTNDLKYWYGTIVAMAFSFMVIEYAPLLLATFIVCVLVRRRELFASWSVQNYKKLLATTIILFIGVILMVWPGAWLKLSLVKNYLFFTYMVFAREGEFGTQTFWQVWSQRLASSPFIYLLVIPSTVIALVRIKQHIFYWPFLLYGALMLIITFRNTSSSPTYISSLLPPLYVITGWVLAGYLKRSTKLVNIGVSTLVVSILIAHMLFYFIPYKSKSEAYTPLKDLINHFRAYPLEEKNILVDRRLLPTLHYYFPHKYFHSYRDKVGSVTSITQALNDSSYDGVLYAGKNHLDLQVLLRQSISRHFNISAISISPDKRITYYEISAVMP